MPKITKHEGPSYEWDIEPDTSAEDTPAPKVTETPSETTEEGTPARAPEEPSEVTETPSEVEEIAPEEYDPSEHSAQHVVDYLATADEDERARVGELEQKSTRPRKSVLQAAGLPIE